MPHIDRRSGEIVMRVVYDGAPEAGKTTNLQRLCDNIALQRRGEVKSPGTERRRTEYFDWLDFAGGYVDGRKVRCQIVSVPGQSQLLHRRRYLLESADAVVFVADARPELVTDARESLETTRLVADMLAEHLPVAVVLQANKQDLPEALAPRALADALGLPEQVPAIGARAVSGEGVMQTFIMAVRLATERVKTLALRGELADAEEVSRTPDALYLAMRAREPETPARGLPLTRTSLLARDEEDEELPLLSTSVARPNPACEQVYLLPRAAELGAGHIWPPTHGRSLLAALELGSHQTNATLKAYAEDDGVELTGAHDAALHSRPGWLFGSEHESRVGLVNLVRTHLRVAPLLPEGRVLFMARDGAGYRVWMVTPDLSPLSLTLAEALRGRDAAGVQRVLQALAAGALSIGQLPEADRELVSAHLDDLAVSPSGDLTLLRCPGQRPPPAGAWLEAACSPLMELASGSTRLAHLIRDAVRGLGAERQAQLAFMRPLWIE